MFLHSSGSNRAPRLRSGLGFSIVELLVGAGILTLSLSALLGFLTLTITTASFLKQQTEATFLAQGLLEALKSFRDGTSWNVDDPQNQYDGLGRAQTGILYHMETSQDIPPRWQLIAGSETLGMFTQSVMLEDVRRDVDSNIVTVGGMQDPNTKKATVAVSWVAKSKNRQIDIATYLTNWKQ